ncbi:MAG: hypothetical protein KBF12_08920 [Sebaldella sp.]|nr:hypothetical protein [Sebaldella sp.]
MEELKDRIKDIYVTMETFKTEDESADMSDDQVAFIEELKFHYFMKGFIVSNLSEDKF